MPSQNVSAPIAVGKIPVQRSRTVNTSDVICFANDWAADPLSKKHIMVRFAKHRRVLWINSINNRRPRLAKKDVSRVFQKLRGFKSGLAQVQDNIWVLSPLFIPFHQNPLCRILNRKLLGIQIRRAVRKLGLQRPVTWAFGPTASDVVGHLGEHCVVYHCVDEFSAFTDAADEIKARETDLLHKSDLVVVSSTKLFESKSKLNSNTHLVLHGVDYEHFRCAASDAIKVAEELKAMPRPVLGFHGLIADWVDVPLMAEIARKRPNWSIALIGKAEADLSPFSGLSNVHMLGHRPYSRLPEYLKGFDVAILPFVINELTLAANPLKLREYLAAGLPVISAPLPEVLKLGDLVGTATDADGYIKLIEDLIKSRSVGPDPDRADQVKKESWDYKVDELEDCLERTLSGIA